MGTLTFLRRTQKEIEIFGGDVFSILMEKM